MFQFILVILACIFLLFSILFTLFVLCDIVIEKASDPLARWLVAILWTLFYIFNYFAHLL